MIRHRNLGDTENVSGLSVAEAVALHQQHTRPLHGRQTPHCMEQIDDRRVVTHCSGVGHWELGAASAPTHMPASSRLTDAEQESAGILHRFDLVPALPCDGHRLRSSLHADLDTVERHEGPTHLLIAEEKISVKKILNRPLKKVGVEADFVENGRQRLDALETGKYGILVTDLHMPGIDGYGLVDAIRKKEKTDGGHFPVIALTADVQMAQRDAYLRHGFDECLLKPVSLGQFRRLLIRWGLLKEAAPEHAALPKLQKKTTAAVDKAAMRELMGAFDDNAIEMLNMFSDMTAPLIKRIQKAQDQNDFHDLKEAAHSLKGAARSACCNILGDMASELQDNAERKKASVELVRDIVAEFARAEIEIKTLKAD